MPHANALYGPLDPAPDAGWPAEQPRMGFFTDTSVCIGCKACEVACKEWNGVPQSGLDLLGMSYDNTQPGWAGDQPGDGGDRRADQLRHRHDAGPAHRLARGGSPDVGRPGVPGDAGGAAAGAGHGCGGAYGFPVVDDVGCL